MNFAKLFLIAPTVAIVFVSYRPADAGVQSQVKPNPVQSQVVVTQVPQVAYRQVTVSPPSPQIVYLQATQVVQSIQCIAMQQSTLVEVTQRVRLIDKWKSKRLAKKAEMQTFQRIAVQRIAVQPVTLGCGE